MPTIEEDRRWFIEQHEYLYGRKPSAESVDHHVKILRDGMSRAQLMRLLEQQETEAAVVRLFKEVYGREPSAASIRHWSVRLKNGTFTRKTMREHLQGTTEALLKENTTPEDDSADQDALTYLKGVLEDYGLGNLGDWAWEQIQQGYSPERIMQNLREQDAYKQRFQGLEMRRAAGLPAISEGEYIAYERDVRQMMRAAGLPADFYDNPDDFAGFIGQDVSAAEMQARINDGYLAASQAPPEVRQQLRDLYGVQEGELAAFFLDPDRALPVIQRRFNAAQVSGAAFRTGYGALGAEEAERIASFGISADQAEEGFGVLLEAKELFGGLPGEDAAAIDRETQQAAVFGGDAAARQRIERRGRERVSQASGAQSFTIGQGGIAGLREA